MGGRFGDGEWTSTYCCRAGGGLVEDRGCCGELSAEEYLFAVVYVRCWDNVRVIKGNQLTGYDGERWSCDVESKEAATSW